MNVTEYFEYARNFTKEMIELSEKKNADYSNNSLNPFDNFTAVEELGICTTEQGFMTRLTDKYKRLITYVSNDKLQVKEETVHDTLQDMCNYLIMFSGYLKHKEEKKIK